MLILASNSPRRKELLSMLGYEFIVRTSNCDENSDITDPYLLVKELARRKASAVSRNDTDTVIGSDTVVAINGKILGKPENKADAASMLHLLSGKTHTVYTGVCILQGDAEIVDTVSCDVTFKAMTEKEIEAYINSGEPMDKAGAYGIQGKGSAFVEKINGDYFAVVGLPCCFVSEALKAFEIYPKE